MTPQKKTSKKETKATSVTVRSAERIPPPGLTAPPQGARPQRELIVIAKPGFSLVVEEKSLTTAPPTTSASAKEVPGLAKLLADSGARIVPLFGPSEASVQRRVDHAGKGAPPLQLYYRVLAEEKLLEPLAKRLRLLPQLAAAYVKPAAEAATFGILAAPLSEEPPDTTPDFTPSQGYLNASPEGIYARYAWKKPGGLGEGVQIIDVEGAWRFTHETLLENQGGLVIGTPSSQLYWRNHGTAVLGVFSGDGVGITGISPASNVRAASILGGSAPAVASAADLLGPGDLLLFELHRPGPRYGHVARPDLRGYIPPEWWPDDFAAIQYATMLGVVVVEVAGNGAEDLDDPLYDAPEPGFPEDWVNPFRRIQDSGSIFIGAGAPPPGTHGKNHGPDRSRVGYSNYGSCVDAQGWGFEITTSGYGDLQGGSDEDRWYSAAFNGTSGASAMVTGVLGCVQGALDAHGLARLTPTRARHILRTSGSPQEDAPARPVTERIGNRPNLRQIFLRLGLGNIQPEPPVDELANPVSAENPEP